MRGDLHLPLPEEAVQDVPAEGMSEAIQVSVQEEEDDVRGTWYGTTCTGCGRNMGEVFVFAEFTPSTKWFPSACSTSCRKKVGDALALEGVAGAGSCPVPGCSKRDRHWETPGDEIHAVPPPPSLTGAREARLREDPR